MGETFSSDPSTGTATFTIPVPVSPARDLTPRLDLIYSTAAPNGVLGLGWALPIGAVERRTDRRLPRYDDSDTFLLGGDELVAVSDPSRGGRRRLEHRRVDGVDYEVSFFRRRTEKSPERIELWLERDRGVGHWRVIDAHDVVSRFGTTARSRIADPDDPTHVLTWLLADVRDDRGNAAEYRYKAEDAAGAGASPGRGDRGPGAARHLKRIRYGNRRAWWEREPGGGDWLFEVVLDYGEHDETAPTPHEQRPWALRADPFSSHRGGFEVRVQRLCRRILTFHHFREDPVVGRDRLVRSTELTHAADPVATTLVAVDQVGHALDGTRAALPPLEFTYAVACDDAPVRTLDPDVSAALPAGHRRAGVRWVPLHGDGLVGALTDRAGAWHYAENRGGGHFGPAVPVGGRPTTARVGELTDLTGDGVPDVVVRHGSTPGYAPAGRDGWSTHHAFGSVPSTPPTGRGVVRLDLTGDGQEDIMVVRDRMVLWYRSRGVEGLDPPRCAPGPVEPLPTRSDSGRAVLVADFSGDGLEDVAEVGNGCFRVWANLGWGRFAEPVAMPGAPWFDDVDRFDARRVIAAGVDGLGPADLVYPHPDGPRHYRNEAGNRWGPARTVHGLADGEPGGALAVVDLPGTGTACVVRASGRRPLRYVELTGGVKPGLLTGVRNNLGTVTRLSYTPSTAFALADRAAGRPWPDRLPTVVHLLARVETVDEVARGRLVSTFTYSGGGYDPVEREVRPFARVDQRDAERIAVDGAIQHLPPVLTRTWFSTGGEAAARPETFHDPGTPALPDLTLPSLVRAADGDHEHRFTADERRQARRAARGAVLRREVYVDDDGPRAGVPVSVEDHHHGVDCRAPAGPDGHAVFALVPREVLTARHERTLAADGSPDPTVAHEVTLEVDRFGDVLTSVALAYGRRCPDATLGAAERAVQARRHAVLTAHDYTAPVDRADAHRAPVRRRTRTLELLDPAVDPAAPLELAAVARLAQGAGRLLAETRVEFRRDDLDGTLPSGELGALGLVERELTLALDAATCRRLYVDRVTDADLRIAGLTTLPGEDGWWIPGPVTRLAPGRATTPAAELAHARRHFFVPRRVHDPFGAVTEVDHDPLDLLPRRTRDPLGNTVSARNDHRVLAPWRVTDPNGNRTDVAHDALGRVVGIARRGKQGERVGETLDGFVADLDPATLAAAVADPAAHERALLGGATSRTVHDTGGWAHGRPATTVTLQRVDAATVHLAVAYADGTGREVQTVVRREPGADGAPRWARSGWTVLDGKGNPVRRYEPRFVPDHRFRADDRHGVSPLLCHDALGRLVAAVHPDGSWEKVEIGPWSRTSWDAVDTVGLDPRDDPDAGPHVGALEPGWRSWARRRLDAGDHEVLAAATAIAATPTTAGHDPLGRVVHTVARLRDGATVRSLVTRTVLDVLGRELAVVDALGRTVSTTEYDLAGRPVVVVGAESGRRWTLGDVAGVPVLSGDARGHREEVVHDALRRPTAVHVSGGDVGERRVQVRRVRYGEDEPDAWRLNLRTRAVADHDGAGVARVYAVDHRDRVVRSGRRFCARPEAPPDWSGPVALAGEEHVTATAYDGIDRPIVVTTADGSVTRSRFGVGGLLERVEVTLRGEDDPLVVLAGQEHDAHGRRTRARRGNGAVTGYAYDPETFRLTRLLTTRSGAARVQDLGYRYDPAGHVLRVDDGAETTAFFRNRPVAPGASYRYDSLYRLVEATGRERLGAGSPGPERSAFGPLPGDGDAVARYRQRFAHDDAGNLRSVRHRGADPAAPGWTRRYHYDEPSPLDAVAGNRLSAVDDGRPGSPPRLHHDANGNVTHLPGVGTLVWDHDDRLAAVRTQVAGGPAAETVHRHDAAGTRVRQAWRTPSGRVRRERLYLGALELLREYAVDGTVRLERRTLHVHDGERRLAVVETRPVGHDRGAARLVRHQLGDHLDSAVVELDEHAAILTHEEYHPYGSTAYRARRRETETPKRYGFTGRELDDNGLARHGERFYAPWLGRWTSPDPAGTAAGLNVYAYAANDPVRYRDTGGRAPENTVEDLLEFLHREAGFAAGAKRSLDLDPRMASPAGTQNHAAAVDVLKDMKKVGYEGAERVFVEVRTDPHGVVAEIGGKPKGPKGSLNPDVAVMPRGQTLGKGTDLSGRGAELIADLKYGDGKINKKYDVLGSKLLTVNGRTTASTAEEAAAIFAARMPDAPGAGVDSAGVAVKATAATGADAAASAAKAAKAGKAAVDLGEKVGKLGGKLAKSLPVLGWVAGIAATTRALSNGEYGEAALEAVGTVFDPVDWASTAWTFAELRADGIESIKDRERALGFPSSFVDDPSRFRAMP